MEIDKYIYIYTPILDYIYKNSFQLFWCFYRTISGGKKKTPLAFRSAIKLTFWHGSYSWNLRNADHPPDASQLLHLQSTNSLYGSLRRKTRRHDTMFFHTQIGKDPKVFNLRWNSNISENPQAIPPFSSSFGIWSSISDHLDPFGHFWTCFQSTDSLGLKWHLPASNRPKKDSTQEVHLATELVMKKPSNSETKTLLLMLTGLMPTMFPQGESFTNLGLVVEPGPISKIFVKFWNLPQISPNRGENTKKYLKPPI